MTNIARTSISMGIRALFKLRLNWSWVHTNTLLRSLTRGQLHCAHAAGELRHAIFAPLFKHSGLLVSQKNVIEVKELSAYWIGFVQNIQITVFNIFFFGTTDPPVEVQKPITIGTRTAAIWKKNTQAHTHAHAHPPKKWKKSINKLIADEKSKFLNYKK
jgi:hypothetical protein